MRRKHRRTLEAIYRRPTSGSIRWADVEAMLMALGATIEERSGSRIAIELNGVIGHFHRSHPSPQIRKGVVNSLRRFLMEAGIEPDGT